MQSGELHRLLLHVQGARGIARRYFITNGFDGALTMLGLMVGFFLSEDVDVSVAIKACLGAAGYRPPLLPLPACLAHRPAVDVPARRVAGQAQQGGLWSGLRALAIAGGTALIIVVISV
jgi:hypothetical protein